MNKNLTKKKKEVPHVERKGIKSAEKRKTQKEEKQKKEYTMRELSSRFTQIDIREKS